MKWKEVIKYTATEWSGKWSIDNSVGSDVGSWIEKFKRDAEGIEPEGYSRMIKNPTKEEVDAHKEKFNNYVNNMKKAFEELDELMENSPIYQGD